MTRLRIVLAEDHLEVAEQLRSLLARAFDIVEVVEDGLALIAAVEKHKPDVVIADIAMPRLSGLNAARTILAAQPDARIVLVTVRDEPSVIRTALASGVAGYVTKSDAGEELVTAVHAVAAGPEYLSATARAALNSTRKSS